ncbi:helix-turn-helix domain-containing protein [Sinosporangium siamense]|uniref:helix-turn-helix domain-containing protein n=1 Tax=Sinosporangium siamense TaxID=1367973 RepID=UPI00194ED614|nr:helix-turn-helix transcriptional regulator [Sinosporangium siamense]
MTTGQRIARARRRKGWDQVTLAEMIGRSVSWMSKVENGRLPLDRMSVLGQVAEALGVEIAELTGQPYRHETDDLDSGHAAIPGLRLALQQATMPGGAILLGNRVPRHLDELEANVRLAERLRQDAKFTALGEVLPQIITDLLLITSDSSADRDRAEALMLRACHMARVTSNLLGHHDLGWTAVQRELVAAQQVGAPDLVGRPRGICAGCGFMRRRWTRPRVRRLRRWIGLSRSWDRGMRLFRRCGVLCTCGRLSPTRGCGRRPMPRPTLPKRAGWPKGFPPTATCSRRSSTE